MISAFLDLEKNISFSDSLLATFVNILLLSIVDLTIGKAQGLTESLNPVNGYKL